MRIREQKSRVEEPHTIAVTTTAGLCLIPKTVKAVFYAGEVVHKDLLERLAAAPETEAVERRFFWCVVPTKDAGKSTTYARRIS